MRITIKDGIILSSDKKLAKSGIVGLPTADYIAKANGLDVAETFCNRHEGRSFEIDKDYKIISQVKADGSSVVLRLKTTKKENGKYEFSPAEKADIADQLANKYDEQNAIEEERKSVMSSFKERADRVSLDVATLSRNYKNGYEYRDIECHVEFDWVKNVKRFISVDGGKVVAERPLEKSDYQMTFDMEDKKEEKKSDKKKEEAKKVEEVKKQVDTQKA